MATRTLKCTWCSTKVRVPADTQSMQCPGCGYAIVVAQRNSAYAAPPAINQHNDYYQQPYYQHPYYQHPYYQQPYDHLSGNQYSSFYQQPSSPPRTDQYNYSYHQIKPNQYYGSYQQPWPMSTQSLSQVSSHPLQNNGFYWQSPQISPQVSPSPVYGKKRAVICGVNYLGQKNSLKGSLNDAISMKKFLLNQMGFPIASVLVLTEEETDNYRIPTRHNIEMALRWLVEGCQSGDSLVFYYSGHASRRVDLSGDEIDGYDELLCPVDYSTAGKISDDEINATIIRPLPRGAKLHAITDTCFSGTMVDLPFVCRMNWKGQLWEDHRVRYGANKGTSGGLAISISACDDHQNSGDTTAFTGDSAGVLTYHLIQCVENEPNLTYGNLLNSMSNKIAEAQQRLGAPPQVPQLSSSEKFDVFSRRFFL